MDFQAIRALVQTDLEAVDHLIIDSLNTNIQLVDELSQHIVSSGGKRMRALLVLLSAHSQGYKGDEHLKLAATVELIHTTTLLHDDVVDKSELRRGRDTANFIWGNSASVLVGDFIYSRAFQLMVATNNMPILGMLANASNTIAGGEVQQLMNCHNPTITETQYFDVISKKTATLFSAAAQVGAMLQPGIASDTLQAYANYGMSTGIAFQLMDDILDYEANAEQMGKNSGDDLAEGKPTLPIIYALQHCKEEEAAILTHAICHSQAENLSIVREIIDSTNAIHYTKQRAQAYVDTAHRALNSCPDSIYKEGLMAIASIAANRTW